MNLRQRPVPTRGRGNSDAPSQAARLEEPYNIIPIHSLLSDHPSLRFPEVRAAAAALRAVGDLRRPPFREWRDGMDLMDWLGAFFGFQTDNVRNQREHLVLHLANAQMRLSPPPAIVDNLDHGVLQRFRRKLLRNYESWCSFLRKKSQVKIAHFRQNAETHRRELLYVAMYLLIWGEAGNLRFTPECLCYIYHHMTSDLNKVLAGDPDNPPISGENAFLNKIITPIYTTIKTEVERSRNGKAPHSAWRNYDDINEFFWSRKCFKKLKWPLELSSNFFVDDPKTVNRVGKTGFVEQRTFWNVFRNFDRLWVLLFLFFQASMIVAWRETEYPWQAVEDRDVQVELLTLFITWAGLRFGQSVLDAGTQYSLVSRDSKLLLFRMIMKSMVSLTWAMVFTVFYIQIWIQKNSDGGWSDAANDKIIVFLKAGLVYIIPELLALLLFVIPWVRNFIEETNFIVFDALTWWFHSRLYIGRGLREGLVSNIKYTFFWIVILLSKFSFSYFLQIKPLVAPTKALLSLGRLRYNWHEFFSNTNRMAVVLIWIPVVLMYLVDMQLWYTVISAFVGSVVGLFSHLGEIRNIEQLRLRFQFFSSALQFNLIPEDQMMTAKDSLVQKLRNAIHRIKLRYGLGQPFKKIESSQVDARRFALIWNEIIYTMREEDLISDEEVELMELPPNCWNIMVVRWPCFLLCNELLLALNQAIEYPRSPDRWIWFRICNSEYRRCAVIEAYCSIRFLILEIIQNRSEEHSIVTRLFMEIDHFLGSGEFTKVYKTETLPRIHAQLIKLIGILLSADQNTNKLVDVLQALYELTVKELPWSKKPVAQLIEEGLAPRNPATTEDNLLFVNRVRFPKPDDVFFFRQLRRLNTILTSRDSKRDVPKNLEARRRIAFFSNSLFMNIPRAPQVEKMMAFSVLTPYYEEDVLYKKESLRTPNNDGISTLFYLQKIYQDEWDNFIERMRGEGMKDDDEIFKTKSRELRVWASYRGQTLARTVRGMMYYYRALKILAYLDSASEVDIKQGSQNIDYRMAPRGARSLNRAMSSLGVLKGNEVAAAMMKFTYVVSCQKYGSQKQKGEQQAEDILNLMKNNEALRVAYVDEVRLGRDEVEYYSVLVKYDDQSKKEEEIYRIKLPGPMKLGEGKPENQNHAIIFTRGDALQTIDMNQDNSFEEALKMRNLLEEFTISHGIRKPTILGVRENIFTGTVSSLAWFMSTQEMSFVTLGQRVLANPLKIRMHYGHPDVFDRFWFITRGGISKASKTINISEDIFAGFNCTLRGGNVTHHEYIQVGKGRDVGLNQISMFEAKVASGNGEQVLSRDVYRLGHRLDFFRMLSFFYSTIGFYYNTMIMIVMIYTLLWGRLYLALSGIEGAAMDNTQYNKAFGAVLNQQFVVQIGVFTALPMIVENSLEHGFLSAVWDYITMQLQLASVFFTFSMGTRSHYFGRTILHGGAKYQATGRGFVVEHKSFADNYRLYARSHFVKAIELGVILTVYASNTPLAISNFLYIILNISSWFLVVSWIMAPFVFNPSGFDWLKTVYDFNDFVKWLWYGGGSLAKAEVSWETWWYEEQDHLRTTGLWGKLLEIILDLRFFFFQYGVVYHLNIANNSTSIVVYLLSWVFMIVAVGIYIIIAYAQDKFAVKEHVKYRLVQLLVSFLIVLVVILMLEFTKLTILDMFWSILGFIPTGWGIISIAQVLRPFLESSVVWDTVVSVARLYDMLIGMFVLAPLAFLSWMPGFQAMQTRILFNEAFSRGLQISRILTGKNINMES
ncbi:callose synthase 11-like [Cynara cardunculus var. scolymus]|uniref:1,3-beta-glucan synthase n=1 Tax=Cynara cardunculus var. scolymus TaxID=59895 RepID=A0A103XF28_CYNCS|nr:callose synthase 11-like [Cynara cardunculus var. scolymus]XP_024993291.1 callose synthase 11-like [Cynara cardunculus var. scolymus]KVH89522.1 1,3-beta-glucan synthase subunit FKS1-like, domain-1 [Cynara cardunculus var. scolymus]